MGRGNIFLVGMMGAGKTTLGKALAQRLAREFVDTDRLLVGARRGGRTIFDTRRAGGFDAEALARPSSRSGECVVAGRASCSRPESPRCAPRR
jgi:shikimate kinase